MTFVLVMWREYVVYRCCSFCSSFVSRSFSKFALVAGVWPAHWMLPQNGYSVRSLSCSLPCQVLNEDQCLDEGEMDITEMVSGDGTDAWNQRLMGGP